VARFTGEGGFAFVLRAWFRYSTPLPSPQDLSFSGNREVGAEGGGHVGVSGEWRASKARGASLSRFAHGSAAQPLSPLHKTYPSLAIVRWGWREGIVLCVGVSGEWRASKARGASLSRFAHGSAAQPLSPPPQDLSFLFLQSGAR